MAFMILVTEFVITVIVTIIITLIAKNEFDKRYEAAEKLSQEKKRKRREMKERRAMAEMEEANGANEGGESDNQALISQPAASAKKRVVTHLKSDNDHSSF